MEYTTFPLAHQIVEAEQKLELQSDSSTNIRTEINNANSDCNYKPTKGIILVHYSDIIYVTKIVSKRVLKCDHCYIQQSVGDILPRH